MIQGVHKTDVSTAGDS